MLERIRSVVREPTRVGPHLNRLVSGAWSETRMEYVSGWDLIAENFEWEGEMDLASLIRRVEAHMAPRMTERQPIAQRMRQYGRH